MSFGLQQKKKQLSTWEDFADFEEFAKKELVAIEKLKFDLENELKEIKDIEDRLGYLKAQVTFSDTLKERFEIQIQRLYREYSEIPFNTKKVETYLRIIGALRKEILERGRIIFESLQSLILTETHLIYALSGNKEKMESYSNECKEIIASIRVKLTSINSHNEFLENVGKKLEREKAKL